MSAGIDGGPGGGGRRGLKYRLESSLREVRPGVMGGVKAEEGEWKIPGRHQVERQDRKTSKEGRDRARGAAFVTGDDRKQHPL